MLNNIELEDDNEYLKDIKVLNVSNKITLKYYDDISDTEEKGVLDINILGEVDKKGNSLTVREFDNLTLFVTEDYLLNHQELKQLALSKLYIYTNNVDKLEDYFIANYPDSIYISTQKMYQSEKNLMLIIRVFVYTFMILVSLIVVTNIFNTISTSMMLRKREFAVLSSIGMSNKEFNRMIILESTLYSIKSLIYGIVSSLAILFFMMSTNVKGDIVSKIKYLFENLYYPSIILSIVVVTIIILITMFYSLSKIKKENTVETIRNDNI